jgi:hypothetical protein
MITTSIRQSSIVNHQSSIINHQSSVSWSGRIPRSLPTTRDVTDQPKEGHDHNDLERWNSAAQHKGKAGTRSHDEDDISLATVESISQEDILSDRSIPGNRDIPQGNIRDGMWKDWIYKGAHSHLAVVFNSSWLFSYSAILFKLSDLLLLSTTGQ